MAEPEVVTWYTHARRFPILIGKAALNGGRLPGGPYRASQVVAFAILLWILKESWGLWARGNFFLNLVILFGVPVGVAFGVGKLPTNGRNPLFWAYGALRWATSPSLGRYGGRPLRLRRPTRVRHRAIVLDPAAPPPPTTTVNAPVERRQPDGAEHVDAAPATPLPAAPLDHVQQLLTGHKTEVPQ